MLTALQDRPATPSLVHKEEIAGEVRIARSVHEVLQAFSIRSAVFVGEQECPFDEEFDGNDFCATHLIAYRGNEPAACLRIRYFNGFAKLERLAVRHEYRDALISRRIVRAAIDLIGRKGYTKIYGQSQDRLLKFWCKFGFRPLPKRVDLVFSDFSYTEIVMDVPPHPEAISLDTDPYVLIRPEGAWDKAGILEESAERPVTSPLRQVRAVA